MKRLALLALAVGCTGAPVRSDRAPPDLLVVVLPAGAPATPPTPIADRLAVLTDAHAVHTHPAHAMRALLTGQWPGTTSSVRPNTMQGVLGLYGYRTVGHLPDALQPADAPWLADGLESDPMAGRGCLTEQLEAVADLHPTAPDEAVFTLVVGPWCADGHAGAFAALTDLLTDKPPVRQVAVVSLTGQADDAALATADTRAALWLSGPGLATGAGHPGMASVVDVMPSLLPEARAVVPSDATGTNLRAVVQEGDTKASVAVFQQDAQGALAIRTTRHLLRLPPTPVPLPEAVPEGSVLLTADGQPAEGADPAPLYATLRHWDQRRRATSAADRMGDAAFREMLRDQGYWH